MSEPTDLEWQLLDVGEEIARARAELERLKTVRADLITRARAAGVSTRKIAAVADVSETMVRKILGEGGYG
jgi:DNA-directed RNA polymerase specialized sigma24 family protein